MKENLAPEATKLNTTQSCYSFLRWSLRDLMWMLVVISLLISLLIATPVWKKSMLQKMVLPPVHESGVTFDLLDSSSDYVTYVVQVGQKVVIDVELHRFNDVSTDPSNNTLIEKFRLNPGQYGISWWKLERQKSTELYCFCNGNMLHASLKREDFVLREMSSGGGIVFTKFGSASTPIMLVENRDNQDRTERIQLVLRCLEN